MKIPWSVCMVDRTEEIFPKSSNNVYMEKYMSLKPIFFSET